MNATVDQRIGEVNATADQRVGDVNATADNTQPASGCLMPDLPHSMWNVVIVLWGADEFGLVHAYDLLDNKCTAAS